MARTVVALDVGGTKIAGALVVYGQLDEPPRVERAVREDTDARQGGSQVLAKVSRIAQDLVAVAREQGLPPVVGVGVGAAGVVDPGSGRVLYANDLMPGWTGQPLESRLRESVGLPAAAMGDVHAHALGEARWGSARGAASCLCVAVGTGLGGAYVLDGSVVRGFHGAAGHLGHSLHPAAAGIRCSCGSAAHVESVTSGTAIAALYQGKAVADELDPQLMGDTVAARAREGELEAVAVIEAAGRALGQAIGSWCNLFDPELVVLSGSVAAAGFQWRRALDEGFKSQVMAPLSDTCIVNAALGADAPLIGAAENVLDFLGSRGDEMTQVTRFGD